MNHSEYIEKRLLADQDFYHYPRDVEITSCLCQNHCKEWPTVLFDADTEVGMNPVKASDMLRKKLQEAQSRIKKVNSESES